MRRCLKGLGGRPTSTDGFILGPVTRLSGSACFYNLGFYNKEVIPCGGLAFVPRLAAADRFSGLLAPAMAAAPARL